MSASRSAGVVVWACLAAVTFTTGATSTATSRPMLLVPPAEWDSARSGAGPTAETMPREQATDADHPVGAPATHPRNEPAVAVNPRDAKHVVVAAHDTIDGRFGVSAWSSTDGGRTFGTPTLMPRPQNARYQADASVGFDSRGNVIVGYLVYNPRPTDVGGIYVARSPNGVDRWTSVKVASNSLKKKLHDSAISVRCVFQDKSYLTVDRSIDRQTGRPRDWVYITWQEINYSDDQCTEFALERIMVARSTDGGNSFEKPVQISQPRRPFDFGAMPYVGPDGNLYVAYVSIADNGCIEYSLDIKMARSTDGGKTFAHSLAAPEICGVTSPSRTGSLYRQNSLPSLTINPKNGMLAIAWANDEGPNQSVRIRTSRDKGRTWSDGGAVTPVPGIHQFPWLAYSPDGEALAVTYIDHIAGGFFHAYLASSTDDGKTWSTPKKLSSAPSQGNDPQYQAGFIGDYNGMAIGRDGVAHPVWTDLRTPWPLAGQNIWTRSVKL